MAAGLEVGGSLAEGPRAPPGAGGRRARGGAAGAAPGVALAEAVAERGAPGPAVASPREPTTAGLPPRGRWRSLVKYVLDPRRMVHTYSLLLLICLFIPGPYFADAALSSYKLPVSEGMRLSNEEFGLLFAVSSLTGVLCGPVGAAITRLGRTSMALGAGLACAVGSLFTVLGFRWGLLRVMLLARCVFWLALNALLMVQTLLVYSIFKGKAVDVAYSLIVTACRLGGVLGYCLSGPMLGRCGLEGALWVSVGMVFLAFGATLLFAYLFRGSATARSVRPHLERRRSSRSPASSPRSQTGSVRPEPSEFSLRLLRSMPRSVLSLTFATGALYGTVFPFEVVANDMLQNEFRYDANSAGYLVTVIPAVSIFSPLLSQLLGTGVRCRLAWCCAGFVMLISAQLLICTWDPSVTIPCLALMGLGFAASVCSIWTTLPLLLRLEVPEEDYKAMEGLATSLGFSTLAVTQFISNLAVGALRDAGSYRAACAWLASVSSAGLLCLVAAIACHAPLAGAAACAPAAPEEAADWSSAGSRTPAEAGTAGRDSSAGFLDLCAVDGDSRRTAPLVQEDYYAQ